MAKCTSCGSELKPGARFCENCGATVPQAPVNPAPQPQMAYQNPSYGAQQAPQQAPQPAPEQTGNVPPVDQNMGAQQTYNYTPVAPIVPIQQQKTTNGMAIAALIMGILSIVSLLCCCYFAIFGQIIGLITGVLGIIFGVVSKKNNGGKVPGMGVAGIVMGAIGALLNIVLLLIYIVAVGAASGSSSFVELLRKLGVDESTINELMESMN